MWQFPASLLKLLLVSGGGDLLNGFKQRPGLNKISLK
jgi:hypothetical protein